MNKKTMELNTPFEKLLFQKDADKTIALIFGTKMSYDSDNRDMLKKIIEIILKNRTEIKKRKLKPSLLKQALNTTLEELISNKLYLQFTGQEYDPETAKNKEERTEILNKKKEMLLNYIFNIHLTYYKKEEKLPEMA